MEYSGICYYEQIDGKSVDITEDIPFDLPNGWNWTRLISVGQTNIGLTYKPSDICQEGIPVLRSNNIKNGKLDLSDVVRVSCEITNSLILKESDILICARNGSKSLVGKCAEITNSKEIMSFGAFMAVFRSQTNKWILHILNSDYFREYLFCSNSTQICQITQDMLKKFLIPFPPLKEQQRIAEKIAKINLALEAILE